MVGEISGQHIWTEGFLHLYLIDLKKWKNKTDCNKVNESTIHSELFLKMLKFHTDNGLLHIQHIYISFHFIYYLTKVTFLLLITIVRDKTALTCAVTGLSPLELRWRLSPPAARRVQYHMCRTWLLYPPAVMKCRIRECFHVKGWHFLPVVCGYTCKSLLYVLGKPLRVIRNPAHWITMRFKWGKSEGICVKTLKISIWL